MMITSSQLRKNKVLKHMQKLFPFRRNRKINEQGKRLFKRSDKARKRGKHSFGRGERFSLRHLDLDQERKVRRRRRLKRIGLAIGFFTVTILLIGGLVFWQGDLLRTLFSPISFVANLINPIQLKETDGRVNVLILGLDTQVKNGRLNTDTILIGSFSLTEGDPVLISIPRDFWVSFDGGRQGKINTAYASGAMQPDGSIDEKKGMELAKKAVERILGIPLHYWVMANFEGFKEIIDTLGGIRVCVERTFDDYTYPVPGKERAPLYQRYEHLHFDKGCQKMSGERALKYNRSRMGTAGEGSDFARVRRQQKVLLAVKDKILSLSLIFNPGKVVRLYNQLTKAIKTNAALGESQRALEFLYKFQELTEAETLVLDPKSKLTYVGKSSLYGGAYVIVPKGGNSDAIHKAVQKLLFQ